MAKPKDLTPKFKKMKPAFKELEIPTGAQESGQSLSGNSTFSNIFSRGRGETVFDIANKGITASAVKNQQSKGGFETIQDAIDWVEPNGGGIVRIPIGEYSVDSDITLSDNIIIVGEDRELTIIDFDGVTLSSGGFVADGESISEAGTVSVNTSGVVTGTSTQFQTDGVQVGDYLVITSVPYKISAVNSETELELEDWPSRVASGESTDIGSYTRNAGISNLTVKNASTTSKSGVDFDYCINATIENISVIDSYIGINLGRAFNIWCANNICRNSSDAGIKIGNVVGGSITSNFLVDSSNGEGIQCSAASSDALVISQNTIANNGGNGVLMLLANEVVLESNIITDNELFGIFFQGAEKCIATSNVVKNNAFSGIALAAQVSVDSIDNIVESNMILDNGGWGIVINSDQNGNLIHGNFTTGNSSGTIDDSGTGNSVVDNYS